MLKLMADVVATSASLGFTTGTMIATLKTKDLLLATRKLIEQLGLAPRRPR